MDNTIFIRRKEVSRLTGLGRSTIYEMMKAGTFPKSVPLGPRTVGWDATEIALWQEQCLAKRAKAAA
ncbi:AlpA family transcriptional regulator [Mesorhizobium sp. WSM4310]|uniref:helix-turn-helix transcriptional regulator n=1 Tax=Mesorhizobium sp. WSM4310 TaxID=2589883 RepID=UPI00115E8EBA|nr:AlpA family transcriptional regulator [Mesorhizobium sp. WSM4310]TRC91157.1 AlpA family transcriptional regulator [Mesorhizobium sp. WSM4310]